VACKIVDLELAMQQISPSQSPSIAGKSWETGIERAREEKKRLMREINILAKISHVSYPTTPGEINLTPSAAEYHQPEESLLFTKSFVSIAFSSN
jgi:hypothetical protein